MTTANCPSDDQLRAFAVGELASLEFERVAGHVADCPSCDTSLAAMDDADDVLITQLRELESRNSSVAIAVPRKLIVAAKAAAIESVGGSSTEVSIDAGRKYSKRVAEGPCRLGKFELRSELGVGSFGYVFLAHDTELDRTVAVKIQRTGTLANDEDVQRYSMPSRKTSLSFGATVRTTRFAAGCGRSRETKSTTITGETSANPKPPAAPTQICACRNCPSNRMTTTNRTSSRLTTSYFIARSN